MTEKFSDTKYIIAECFGMDSDPAHFQRGIMDAMAKMEDGDVLRVGRSTYQGVTSTYLQLEGTAHIFLITSTGTKE